MLRIFSEFYNVISIPTGCFATAQQVRLGAASHPTDMLNRAHSQLDFIGDRFLTLGTMPSFHQGGKQGVVGF
jgi:hypothetical protein